MNIDCRIIGDLLPLYADGTCSSESRALVDEHLAACPGCQKALQRMQSERFALTHPPLDTPKLADYALTVKKRRRRRSTVLTLAAILLIVLLSLAAASWLHLIQAQHPFVPAVEENICNLADGEVSTFSDTCDGRRLFTNSTKITVTFRSDALQSGEIVLWSVTDPENASPIMCYKVDGASARCEFTNLSSAERYFVRCEGLSGSVVISDGRPTNLLSSFLDMLRILSPH